MKVNVSYLEIESDHFDIDRLVRSRTIVDLDNPARVRIESVQDDPLNRRTIFQVSGEVQVGDGPFWRRFE